MIKRIATVVAVLVLACGMLFSQDITSTIVGHVTDPSGAPVPEANVTVTNSDTGAVRTVTTGADGNYSVPDLLAGTYQVAVSKQGFAAQRTSAVHVLSSETRRVNATLKIGSVQQTVEVTAKTTPVTTDSMTIASSVSEAQLRNLPTSLQTVDSFISLAPGVQSAGNATNPPIGGGTHWGSVNFTVNGVSNIDAGNSGAATVQGVGLLVLPPPTSIQELKVQANGMDARYRDHSAVTLVTKSGTNQLHFLLYEYLQNTALNSNTYVRNAQGLSTPVDHLNQFGGNIGGPIWKNKLFFFFDYSGYRHRAGRTVQFNMPSMAMRQGDFSALLPKVQLYNPFTGQPFANNQIPANLIAPQAQALLKFLPAPTITSSPGLPSEPANYYGTVPITQNSNSEDVRVDYNISPNDQLFGVYGQHIAVPWNSSTNYPANYGQGRYAYKNFTASASETHIFNASTLNDFRAAWADYATRFSGQNQDFNPQSLFPQMPDTMYRGIPTMAITGYSGMFHDYGTGLYTPRWDVELTDNFTHTHGRHTFQAGFDETGYKVSSRVPSTGSATGHFSFSGKWTGNRGYPTAGYGHSAGNSFADFLLGTADSTATAPIGAFAAPIYSRDWGAYVQDTWQATSALTLMLGLRYEYQSPWKYRSQTVTTFDVANNKLVLPENSATPTLLPGMDPAEFAAYPYETTQSIGLGTDYLKRDRNNFSPRLGFAWRPFGDGDTVIRGGYGVYYNFQPAFVGSRSDGWNPPWLLSASQNFTSDLPGKPAAPFQPDLTFSNPFPSSNGKQVISRNPLIRFLQWDFQNARTQEWTLTLEHGFAGGWVARASYAGNHSDHIPYNFGPINVPTVQQPNVPTQKQRPYQPWGAINETRSLGIQNFNQVQLGVRRRFANGFSFQGEYEFTRSLDDVPTSGGPQIPTDPMSDYGNSNGIRRHWLVFNYVYQLPFGRGRRWMNAGGIANAVLGGWELSGITTYGTGTPLDVHFSQAGTGIIGWWTTRANRVPGVPIYAGQESGHDVVDGVQWFNPAAFTPPQPWEWSNADRNQVFGPGYENWDISAQKSFAVTERTQLKFRADFFDAFNHFNLGNPSATIADVLDNGNPQPNAGVIHGGSGSRVIQLGLTLRY